MNGFFTNKTVYGNLFAPFYYCGKIPGKEEGRFIQAPSSEFSHLRLASSLLWPNKKEVTA